MKVLIVGSGGRELALKLSEALGYENYDREIIEEISNPHFHKSTSRHSWNIIDSYRLMSQLLQHLLHCKVL